MRASLAVVGALVAMAASGTPPQDADWKWLDQHRAAAFDSLMPVSAAADVVVTYFSYRDLYYDEHEAYFSIRTAAGETAPVAYVVKPIGASVQKQLLDMHIGDRNSPFPPLLARVRVSRMRVSGRSCAAVRRTVEALLKLPPPEPELDILVMHPRVHRILQVRSGRTIDLSFVDDYHPLVRWAATSLENLQQCEPEK